MTKQQTKGAALIVYDPGEETSLIQEEEARSAQSPADQPPNLFIFIVTRSNKKFAVQSFVL